jgi:acyl dehydratase
MSNPDITQFTLGQRGEFTRTVTKEIVTTFAEISGDTNPIHLDETYAATTSFAKCIAHGIYSASLISTVLGTIMPGPGGIYVSQSLRFLRPVFIDDTITAFAEITTIDLSKNRIHLKTGCFNQHLKNVAEGESEILLPKQS